MRLRIWQLALLVTVIIFTGFTIPEARVIPVAGASSNDWNKNSFWYAPWGKSGVHKGIDIFGAVGTDILSTTHGLVLFTGELKLGGKVIVVLGPKWRLHYFAHLSHVDVHLFELLKRGEKIGELGDSGNAKGKSPHLHYAIVRVFPAVTELDNAEQGYKKMIYINPHVYLTTAD